MTDSNLLLYAMVDAAAPDQEIWRHVGQHLGDIGDVTVQEMLTKNQFRLAGRDDRGSEYLDRTVVHPDGACVAAFNNTVLCDDRLLAWARNNISADAKDMRFTHTTPGRQRLGPHCDMTRNWVMIWLIETGGSEHRTVFYRQRSTGILQGGANYHVDDYSDLEEIASMQVPCGAWTLLNACVLHSVENIVQGRCALHISFDVRPDVKILDPCFVAGSGASHA